MHNFTNRSNNVLSFTLTLMAIVTSLCALSTCFLDYARPIKLKTGRVEVRSIPNYSTNREINDLGVVSFDVKANLTDVFDWNVKQLFVYLTAEYTSKNNDLNQVVIWDRIIERADDAVLDVKNVASKYYFWDDGRGLKNNRNVSLFLSWNVIPNSGRLLDVVSPVRHLFAFPSTYKKSQSYSQ